MMPPYVYRDARMKAPFHIQGRMLGFDGLLDVRVTRVLRGFPAMWPGRKLRLAVSILPDGPVPLGGTIYTDLQTVRGARFVEAFLSAPDLQVVFDQIKFFRDAPPRVTGDPSIEGFGW